MNTQTDYLRGLDNFCSSDTWTIDDAERIFGCIFNAARLGNKDAYYYLVAKFSTLRNSSQIPDIDKKKLMWVSISRALEGAINGNQYNIIDLILQDTAQKNLALFGAATEGKMDLIKYIIDNYGEYNDVKMALEGAVISNNIEIAYKILQSYPELIEDKEELARVIYYAGKNNQRNFINDIKASYNKVTGGKGFELEEILYE